MRPASAQCMCSEADSTWTDGWTNISQVLNSDLDHGLYTYYLKLYDGTTIHPIFYVSKLKGRINTPIASLDIHRFAVSWTYF